MYQPAAISRKQTLNLPLLFKILGPSLPPQQVLLHSPYSPRGTIMGLLKGVEVGSHPAVGVGTQVSVYWASVTVVGRQALHRHVCVGAYGMVW
jgi:hypothetical protein